MAGSGSCSSAVEMQVMEPSVGGDTKLIGEGSATMEGEGKSSSCTSWVVEMEEMLKHANPSVEMARWKQQCIYRVPEFIKEAINSMAYRPQFVSLGPLHHGEPHLLPMEPHKRRAVLHMVHRTGNSLGEFVEVIEEVVDDLESAYNVLDDKWRGANRGRFVELMVTDGCFLLECITLKGWNGFNDYAANDPIFSRRSFPQLWPKLRSDMVVLENQLPLVVLSKLLAVQYGTSQRACMINNLVQSFLQVPRDERIDKLGLHILDIFHKSCCGATPDYRLQSDKCELRTPCAVELNEAGIRFKRSRTKSIYDVDFENGVLSMPPLNFHDDLEAMLLNVMAFERLHPDAGLDFSNYIFFVCNIVESERDVALLRREGLLEMIGSDKKMVKMYNKLIKVSWPSQLNRLGHVKWKVNDHCRKRRNKWRASFERTYLSNPWVFISLVAAVILLFATLMQTVYTVVPFYTKG